MSSVPRIGSWACAACRMWHIVSIHVFMCVTEKKKSEMLWNYRGRENLMSAVCITVVLFGCVDTKCGPGAEWFTTTRGVCVCQCVQRERGLVQGEGLSWWKLRGLRHLPDSWGIIATPQEMDESKVAGLHLEVSCIDLIHQSDVHVCQLHSELVKVQ